jgi:hypothetical protein
MLDWLRQNPAASDRKFRLFACVCCRRVWDRFPHPSNQRLVEVVEDHPDDTFEDPVLHAAAVASSHSDGEFRDSPAYWVAKALGRGFYKLSASASAIIIAAKVLSLVVPEEARTDVEFGFSGSLYLDTFLTPYLTPPDLPSSVWGEATTLAALLRDVFGNPLRPGRLDPRWLTSNVWDLARVIYDSRRFDLMPILADALMDAGCDDEAMLSHCRSGDVHVRGCWVVDFLLGMT